MSHIPDMNEQGGRVAVGWLNPDHPFSRGPVPPDFTERLKEFARLWPRSVKSLGWGVAMGVHTCEYCGKAWGSGTFGVPSGDRIFYAPEMIAHYVERHDYAPPEEFASAVMACPLPGTEAYATLVAPFAEQFARLLAAGDQAGESAVDGESHGASGESSDPEASGSP